MSIKLQHMTSQNRLVWCVWLVGGCRHNVHCACCRVCVLSVMLCVFVVPVYLLWCSVCLFDLHVGVGGMVLCDVFCGMWYVFCGMVWYGMCSLGRVVSSLVVPSTDH